MSAFIEKIDEIKEITTLKESIKRGQSIKVSGLSSIHKANIALNLAQDTDKMIIITPTQQEAYKISDDINEMSEDRISDVFVDRDINLSNEVVVSNESELSRINTLINIIEGKTRVVVTSINAALSYTIERDKIEKSVIHIKRGEVIKRDSLIKEILSLGYIRRELIEQKGQFAVRGSIIDIYPPQYEKPVRIDFFDDEIYEIKYFDIDTQRTNDKIDEIKVARSHEFYIDNKELKDKLIDLNKKIKSEEILKDIEVLKSDISLENIDRYIPIIDNKTTILDYFKEKLKIVCEYNKVIETKRAEDELFIEDIKSIIEDKRFPFINDDYHMSIDKFNLAVEENGVFFETFDIEYKGLEVDNKIRIDAQIPSGFASKIEALSNNIKEYLKEGYTVLIAAGSEKSSKLLIDDLNRYKIEATYLLRDRKLKSKKVYVVNSSPSQGFEYPSIKFVMLAKENVKGDVRLIKNYRKGEDIASLSDLEKGDLVVHLTHGIGRFDGITNLKIQGVNKDYIKIKYAMSDILYLSVNQLDMISKYIGKETKKVKLNRLGGNEWTKVQNRVKQSVSLMAKDLIELYAKRQNTKGYSFSKDNDWMKSFEEHFEYEETEDQLRCIEEIKMDMEDNSPMDRLLCGDVGFGKTEVAFRAAFKCALDSKQVAILCPTTILAWQHLKTFNERIGDFPIKIELLSRFKTKKEQKDIIDKLKTNEIDIIIGTHRLVQSDVKFRDLGLAIIDEEQRFGVSQKEKFKELFKGVDVLSLSATPIPRTLNMAMSGIRDMSVIQKPPFDRQTVQTYVLEYNESLITEAIRRELKRNGQVYYIHNRIDTIEETANRVKKMIPYARIAIAHGRMDEKSLSIVFKKLIDKEIDILVCTTIVETGIDVQNVNTMIVENADTMGLAQLYQLKGRVGRSKTKAYAYFTFFKGKSLTEIATKRLSAIKEFTKFGSGFKIALRDLEIRGAGSLLGKKQHGQMEAVGYSTYIRILNDEIKKLKGEKVEEQIKNCIVELPIEACIPSDYIPSLELRLDIYKKIAAIRNEKQKEELLKELKDRFSTPSKSILGLLEISLIRSKAIEKGYSEISMNGEYIRFYKGNIKEMFINRLKDELKRRVYVNNKEKPYFDVEVKDDDLIKFINKILNFK